MDTAVEGQIADDSHKKDAFAHKNAEATDELAPGLMVARAADATHVERLDSSSDAMAGIAMFGHSYSKPEDIGDTGYKPGVELDVFQRGRIYVTAEDIVTPSSGVYVRMIAGDGAAAYPFEDQTFTAEADDDTLTGEAHGFLTGDGPVRVSNAGGALPGGLEAGTDYWVIKISNDTYQLATSLANAEAGTQVPLTTDGTGTQTIFDQPTTERLVVGRAGAFRGTPEGAPLVFSDFTFTAEADDDTATAVAHGRQTGDGPFQVASSLVLPAPLLPLTDYWFIRTGANTFKFASSLANAQAGTAIPLTTDGTGVHTASDTAESEQLVTRQISKLARWRKSTTIPGQVTVLEIDMLKIGLATS